MLVSQSMGGITPCLIVSQLDILLPGKKPFVAPSAVILARKKLGHEPVEAVFYKTQQLWHEKTPHPGWYGLTLHAVDGVVWRTLDTADNDKAFSRTGKIKQRRQTILKCAWSATWN